MRRKLPWRLKANMAARSLLLQACWNYEGMQNLGFAFTLLPWLRRIQRRGGGSAAEGLKRHLEFFNTQPYMASFIIGVTGRLEEDLSAAPPEARPELAARISRLKQGFGAALAGIGDAFFWATLRPFCAALAIAVWLFAWTVGSPSPVLWGLGTYLCAYNAPALWVRWRGLELGYLWGETAAVELKRFRWHDRIRVLRWAGLVVAAGVCFCALLVPPWSAAASWTNVLLLAAALAVRAYGVATPRIYAASVAAAFLAALAGA
ncbi:MAG: PTS system mannose/fructose/sorbose family transporter subunit IID [Elusimicrobia bacterium]|nr:PTS system mannose/fructose/sorbose family transporter subunit IID [Elusimicrobiota bacterium]